MTITTDALLLLLCYAAPPAVGAVLPMQTSDPSLFGDATISNGFMHNFNQVGWLAMASRSHVDSRSHTVNWGGAQASSQPTLVGAAALLADRQPLTAGAAAATWQCYRTQPPNASIPLHTPATNATRTDLAHRQSLPG